MYDFQRSDELEDLQQISYLLNTPVVDIDFQNNLFASPEKNNHHHLPAAPGGGKKRKRATAAADDDTPTNEKNVKKTTHREIEKQRRKEMAKLYTSLRSLLPLEYVKGKRSISDHMHQAVNYINNMQNKISQLRLKKEIAFTKNPNLSTSSSGNASGDSCSDHPITMNLRSTSTVKLNLCGNGLEILITLNRKDGFFPISRMMKKMVNEGINVISYLSSKTHDDATLYSFISEVDDPSCMDIIKLQKTLMDMIMQEPTSSQ